MKYKYEAISVADNTKEAGLIDAASLQEALRELELQDLLVVLLEEEQSLSRGVKGKLKRTELLQFFDELVTLLRAGVPLADAIDSQAEAHLDGLMAVVLREICQGLQQGRQLSEVLTACEINLPKYMFQLIAAGELSGKLAGTIAEGVEQMRFEEQLANEVKTALIYPAVLVATGILAVGLVFALVVPKFSNLLDGDTELPWLASVVLQVGVFFNANGLWVLIALGIFIASIVSLLSRPHVQEQAIDLLSRWPIIGPWLAESETGRWTAVLGALLGSGVPLMESLALANQGVRVPSRKKRLERAMLAVRGGSHLSEALNAQNALTPTAYNILRVGERSGEMPAMLKSLAALYEKSGRDRMKQMLILIEPLAILVIGSSIGTIILGIVLAITASSDIPL